MIRMVFNRTGRFPQRLDYHPEELARISHHKYCMGPPIRSICSRVKQLTIREGEPHGDRLYPAET